MLKGLVFESLPFLPKTTPIQQRGAREQGGGSAFMQHPNHTDGARHVFSLFWTRSAFKVRIQFFVAPLSTLTDADDKPYNCLL